MKEIIKNLNSTHKKVIIIAFLLIVATITTKLSSDARTGEWGLFWFIWAAVSGVAGELHL